MLTHRRTSVSPWYNRNGWLGVKQQVTYTLACTRVHMCRHTCTHTRMHMRLLTHSLCVCLSLPLPLSNPCEMHFWASSLCLFVCLSVCLSLSPSQLQISGVEEGVEVGLRRTVAGSCTHVCLLLGWSPCPSNPLFCSKGQRVGHMKVQVSREEDDSSSGIFSLPGRILRWVDMSSSELCFTDDAGFDVRRCRADVSGTCLIVWGWGTGIYICVHLAADCGCETPAFPFLLVFGIVFFIFKCFIR